MTMFGKLDENGVLSDVRHLSQETILKCPFAIMVPEHYREDGSCKCDDAKERKMMIKEWGYTKADFKNIKLRGKE